MCKSSFANVQTANAYKASSLAVRTAKPDVHRKGVVVMSESPGAPTGPPSGTGPQRHVRVISGVHEGEFPLAGQTVCETRRNLRNVFNIPDGAQAYLNGSHVSGDHVLSIGDELEFAAIYTREQILQLLKTGQIRQAAKRRVSVRGLEVDPTTFSVSYDVKEPVFFGNTQVFHLLHTLARRPGKFICYDDLKQCVWDGDDVEDQTVGRALRRLRMRLKSCELHNLEIKVERLTAALFIQ